MGHELLSTSQDFKISVYFLLLDGILSELDSKNIGLMKAMQSCSPTAAQFLEIDRLLPLVKSYFLLIKIF